VNRPTNITSMVNRSNRTTNVSNITNNTFVNNNRYGGWGGGRGNNWGNNWGGPGYRPAYNNWHNNWHNGYWHGRNWNNNWNNNWNWGSFATGFALGGVTSWGFGSSLYGWGYTTYANPYYIQQPIVVQQPVFVEQPAVVFDYAQPIRTDVPPPDQQAAEPAIQTFDRARSSFAAGDYSGAIVLTDEALAKLPNDPTIHEFRALCLFALGRFDDSAATLYPVLAVGPGWDWSTMIGLYGQPDAYTNQLRGLEAFAQNNPTAASARFLLAYHYMTAGHMEAAEGQLARAVELKPTDKLSRQLLTAMRDADKAQAAAAAPVDGQAPADPMPEIPPVRLAAPPMPQGATLVATWVANPSPGVSITLVIKPEGKFTWDVVQPGGKTRLAGTSKEEDGLLTLSAEDQAEAPLYGLVTLDDKDHFKFKVIGSGDDDPGLSFAKSP